MAGQSPPPAAKPVRVKFSSLPERQRLRILIKMAKSGRHEQAARLLARVPFTGPLARNRNLFIAGLIDKARKDYRTAERKFRTILASDPKLSLVRAELAHTLYLLKDDDGARHNLKLLADAAPTPEAAKKFDNFIDAIDARRPWKLSAYVSMAPSTNFTNGTTTRTIILGGLPFQVTGASRAKSGIGFRGGLNAGYTFRPGRDLSIVTGAGAHFVQYKGSAFDDLIVSQNISVVRSHKNGKIALGISASQRWSGASEFIFEAGPYIAVTQRLSKNAVLFSKLRYLRTRFRDADYRNGATATLDNRLSIALNSASVLYGLSGLQRTRTRRNHLDFWSFYGGLGIYREIPFGVTIYGETKLTRKIYDGNFPLLFEPQKDNRIDVLVSLTKRDFNWRGFAPRLDYTYTKNMSNSPFSDYATHGLNLTVTRAF